MQQIADGTPRTIFWWQVIGASTAFFTAMFLVVNAAAADCEVVRYGLDDAASHFLSPDDARLVSSRITGMLVPQGWRDRFLRSSIAAVISEDKNSVLASATFVSPSHILTAYHPFHSKQQLSRVRVQLGHIVSTDSIGNPVLDGQLRCFSIVLHSITSSPRGHLDYVLAEVVPMDDSWQDSKEKIPAVVPIVPSRVVSAIVGTSAFVVGHARDGSFPNGLSVMFGGRFRSLERYTKDIGTSLSLDYEAHTAGGHSGAPVFDENFRWVALHQRRLAKAIKNDENNTRWHPYIDEYYPDEPIQRLPAQGTPLVDIAQDVLQRRGIAWLCANVPALVEILQHDDTTSCDPARRASASRKALSGSTPGSDSAPAP